MACVPENPLTARVMVNRIWHHHFGRGIVATLDNFGKMGEAPTNQPLLDWLALEFVDRGWSVKQMHRLLMTSQAYQMSSQFSDDENMKKDPENRYNWRFRARRLDAESIRDSILAVSGGLNRDIGGPPVFPQLQKEVLSQESHGIWLRQEDGPQSGGEVFISTVSEGCRCRSSRRSIFRPEHLLRWRTFRLDGSDTGVNAAE